MEYIGVQIGTYARAARWIDAGALSFLTKWVGSLAVKRKLAFRPHNPQLFTDPVRSAQVPLQHAGKTPEHFYGVRDDDDLWCELSHVE